VDIVETSSEGPAYRFRLVGRFSASRDGVELLERDIGSRKGRTLLKLLLLHRGHVVSADRIADVLWGEAPPDRWERDVATLVSRLRKVFGSGAIEGGPGGYRFVGSERLAVDLDDAERLTAEAEAPAVRHGVVLRGSQRDPVRLPDHVHGGSMIAVTGVRPSRRTPVVILVAIAAAWVLSILAQTSGRALLLNHGALIEGTRPFFRPPPLWLALPLFLLAWQVMVVAMMLPSSLPMVRLFRIASSAQPRPRAVQASFLGGYLAVWTGFGAIAFLQDVGIHRLVDRTPWLQVHPYVIAGTALALAGAFQFSAIKDRCLSECRHPGAFLLQHYRRGVGEGFRFGRKHGLFCLGCCWALMLVMFAAGVANLWWMAALGALMFYEKAGRFGDRITPVAGATLIALGALVLVHPAWLPAVFGGSA
jgi:predicted metal-binding membrane protein